MLELIGMVMLAWSGGLDDNIILVEDPFTNPLGATYLTNTCSQTIVISSVQNTRRMMLQKKDNKNLSIPAISQILIVSMRWK